MTPLLQDRTLPYVMLDSREPWKQEILTAVHEIYNIRCKPVAPLRTQGLFCQIWSVIFEHAEHCRRDLQMGTQDKGLSTLKIMLAYIHDHYRERITVDDLAQAGYISKSYCTNLFRKHLHNSPINYIIKYRLELSEELLTNSTMTITNISYQVGFSSSSFFIETFRKFYGCTPLEYRRDHWKGELQAQIDAMTDETTDNKL